MPYLPEFHKNRSARTREFIRIYEREIARKLHAAHNKKLRHEDKKREREKGKKKRKSSGLRSRTSVYGKIVVDALALACSLARSFARPVVQRSHGNSEISVLHSSRRLPIAGLPPSAIPYSVSLPPDSSEPTRCND